jgi:Uncharacterized protein conserved in bacteria
MRLPPKSGQIWRHYKGKKYIVLSIAQYTERKDEKFVIYKRVHGLKVWARPLRMFMEDVSVDWHVVHRFTKLDIKPTRR